MHVMEVCAKSRPNTGIRIPYLPACIEVLYRLSYQGEIHFRRTGFSNSILSLTSSLNGAGGWSTTRPGHINPRNDPLSIIPHYTPGTLWKFAQNLAQTLGFEPPYLPACSEALYRLSYRGEVHFRRTVVSRVIRNFW